MFALLAFAVAQRTREIGIRIAMGAKPRDVVHAVLSKHAAPVWSGVLLGILLAISFGRIERSLIDIPGVQALDGLGFAAGLTFFVLIAVLRLCLQCSKRSELTHPQHLGMNSSSL